MSRTPASARLDIRRAAHSLRRFSASVIDRIVSEANGVLMRVTAA
jgi:hypothetical protein